MPKKILIVEDESLIAFDLSLVLKGAGYLVAGIADSVDEAIEIIDDQNPDMVLLDIFLKGVKTGIDLAAILTNRHIPFVFLSANFQESILERAKTTQPYGFLIKPFRQKELLISLDVAFYRHQNSLESRLRKEKELEAALDTVVASTDSPDKKNLRIASVMQPYIPFDFLEVCVKDTGTSVRGIIDLYRIGFDEYRNVPVGEMLKLAKLSDSDIDKLYEGIGRRAVSEIFTGKDFDEIRAEHIRNKIISDHFNMRSLLNIPLLMHNGEMLILRFYSRKADSYTNLHLELLDRLRRPLLEVFEQQVDFDKKISIGSSNTLIVKDEVKKQVKIDHFEGIIGKSHVMLKIFDLISIVAPLDKSVLILGESGTGKERIAKSIHSLSPRGNKPLVIVNCASLPANLVESELFGHEKGAFTGALERRIGKFEMANNGTIFLDEIGEMSGELQVKLLRVLQEQEIERIGGKGIIPINVRIIAATNCNLEKEVETGKFRLDLYYRLFVFPIVMPSLSERKDDIPILANYFLERCSAKIGRKMTGIAPAVVNQMMAYSWPGNVRELEHFIERSALLSPDSIIKSVSLPTVKAQNVQINETRPDNQIHTIEENSRQYIIKILKSCRGRISGPGGAAEILEIPATTLHSKIKRFGITKNDY